MPLPLRVAFILVVILAATVGLTTVLAANKFRQGLGEVLDSRYRLAVVDVLGAVSSSLDLGVDLGEMQSIQPLLDRTIENDPAVLYVEVLDAEGIILLSSDSSNVGLPAPQAWLHATRLAREESWQRAEAEATVLGHPIVSSFSTVVGTVVLGYSPAIGERRVSEMTWTFIRIGAGAVLVFAVVLVPVVVLLMRPERRALAEAESGIAAVTRGEAATGALTGDPLLIAACTGAAAAFAAMDQIRREAERLNEET